MDLDILTRPTLAIFSIVCTTHHCLAAVVYKHDAHGMLPIIESRIPPLRLSEVPFLFFLFFFNSETFFFLFLTRFEGLKVENSLCELGRYKVNVIE